MDFTTKLLNEVLVKLFNSILFNEEEFLKKNLSSDISLRGVHILEAVRNCQNNNENTMGKISQELGVTAGTFTTLLNNLEKNGYLSRTRSTDDKRKTFINLTIKAEKVLNVHDKYHTKMIDMITSNLSKKEEMALVDLLSKIKYFFSM